MSKSIIITGCLGFIAGYVTEACLKQNWHVLGIDNESPASNINLLKKYSSYKNFSYNKGDICNLNHLYDCDYIINLAASTHVDNSIENSDEFIRTNIQGVHNLLKLVKTKSNYKMPILLHFSTDEVYGDLIDGYHKEEDLLKPSNPYSASKASADLLIQSWNRTYNIPYIIVRPTNNYGIGQYIEKFIPKTCKYLKLEKRVPMHENGTPVRCWIHAEDTANAIITLIEKNVMNDIFNISGNYETSNIEIFKQILRIFYPTLNVEIVHRTYADFSVTRPGQDVRYGIDDSKIRALGWENKKIFQKELLSIVQYYSRNYIW